MSIARRTEKNPKVRKDLNIYSTPDRENPNSINVSSIYGAYRARSVFPPYFSA